MPSRKIEDYAMIGDCQTAALVHRDGTIDWLCWPNFASDACFASLLGTEHNGHWRLTPTGKITQVTRRYRPHTLILETTFQTSKGTVLLTDFMPQRGKHSDLIRIVQCTAGKVTLTTEFCPRFHYGSTVPLVQREQLIDGGVTWIAKAGADLTALRTAVPLEESSPGTLVGKFTLRAGEQREFTVTYGCSFEEVPAAVEVSDALHRTEVFWTEWAAKSRYQGPYGEAVERSLLTLKALSYRPSGGIVAAPTTSLPERLGGALNWDYRYCWIRDATFTLSALLQAGYTDEVTAWRHWLLRAVGREPSQLQILYGIAGERHIADWTVPWLPGYEHSAPVRVGNAAQYQVQQDVYGEIAAALCEARRAGLPADDAELRLQQGLTEHLTTLWQRPGSGMWEERGTPKRFLYSDVMAWLAFDKAVESVEQYGMQGSARNWKKLRDRVRKEAEKRGYHRGLKSFVQHYGGRELDASALLLPIVGFMDANDPRMRSTVKLIERKLMQDGLLLRNLPSNRESRQGAFLACSFWLVEVYALQGRLDEAHALFQKLLGLLNDVGLLSEEYDTRERRFVGNFPQAFSHIALVHAAMRLERCRQPL